MAEDPVSPSRESGNAEPAPESVTVVVVFFLVLAAEAVALAVVSVVVIQGAKLLYALSGRATMVLLRAWRRSPESQRP